MPEGKQTYYRVVDSEKTRVRPGVRVHELTADEKKFGPEVPGEGFSDKPPVVPLPETVQVEWRKNGNTVVPVDPRTGKILTPEQAEKWPNT